MSVNRTGRGVVALNGCGDKIADYNPLLQEHGLRMRLRINKDHLTVGAD